MGEHDPERKAGWMRDPEALRGQNQFAAVGQSNRRSERPVKKNEHNKKYAASAEELGLRSSCTIHLLIRL